MIYLSDLSWIKRRQEICFLEKINILKNPGIGGELTLGNKGKCVKVKVLVYSVFRFMTDLSPELHMKGN